MLRIAAHLRFKGNCREAFSFYQKCLGGKLDLMTVGDSPMAKDMPDMKDKIMHAWLKNDGIELMGADLCKPGQDYDLGNAVLSASSAAPPPSSIPSSTSSPRAAKSGRLRRRCSSACMLTLSTSSASNGCSRATRAPT